MRELTNRESEVAAEVLDSLLGEIPNCDYVSVDQLTTIVEKIKRKRGIKNLEVGDVVIDQDGIKAIVLDQNTEETVMVIDENGCNEVALIDNLKYVTRWCDVMLLVNKLRNLRIDEDGSWEIVNLLDV